METVTLLRYKKNEYIVNHEGKTYVWAGAKGEIPGKKVVPVDVYDFLAMRTTTFRDGELVIEAKTKEEKEAMLDTIYEREEYESNALSREEVVKILNGNYKKLEAELKKITSNTTKRYVLEVAREIKLESAAKQRIIKEWMGSSLNIEELFPIAE